jgi:hypothetical protein
MKHPFPVLAMVLAIALSLAPACSGNKDEDRVREAFNLFLESLDKADPSGLWEVSDEPTQAYFNDLAGEVREVISIVDKHYPEDERVRVRRAVGGDMVGHKTGGRELFSSLLDPRKLSAPQNPDGRKIAEIIIEGDRAVVATRSGESVEFSRAADGGYRTGLFLEAFKNLPGVVTLRDNLASARHNAAIHAQDESGSDEPSEPPSKEAP